MLTGGGTHASALTFALRSPRSLSAVCEEVWSRSAAAGARRRGALALALRAGALLAVRLDVPAFFDNEARYAEVAREMALAGD